MACKHIINSPRHSYIGEGPPNCPYCEIERLRAALQWYADAGDYDKAVDCGRRAKEALGVNEQKASQSVPPGCYECPGCKGSGCAMCRGAGWIENT